MKAFNTNSNSNTLYYYRKKPVNTFTVNNFTQEKYKSITSYGCFANFTTKTNKDNFFFKHFAYPIWIDKFVDSWNEKFPKFKIIIKDSKIVKLNFRRSKYEKAVTLIIIGEEIDNDFYIEGKECLFSTEIDESYFRMQTIINYFLHHIIRLTAFSELPIQSLLIDRNYNKETYEKMINSFYDEENFLSTITRLNSKASNSRALFTLGITKEILEFIFGSENLLELTNSDCERLFGRGQTTNIKNILSLLNFISVEDINKLKNTTICIFRAKNKYITGTANLYGVTNQNMFKGEIIKRTSGNFYDVRILEHIDIIFKGSSFVVELNNNFIPYNSFNRIPNFDFDRDKFIFVENLEEIDLTKYKGILEINNDFYGNT